MRRYSILLEADPDDGSYTVSVPALPGIVTQGANLEEAVAMAKDAIRCHINALIADGQPVPEEGSIGLVSVEVAA